MCAAPIVLCAILIGDRVEGSRRDDIRPSHPVHLANGVECSVCHASAPESKSGADDLLPTKAVCANCHDVEAGSGCPTCHMTPGEPGRQERITKISQLFSHKDHLARGMECASCHGMAENEPHLPQKATCRACHPTAAGFGDCRVCHAKDEPLLPITHTLGWLSFHGAGARTDAAACGTCHTQTSCQECHAGDNVRPRSHGLNYSFQHAIDAKGHEIACGACHEEAAFCASCHAAQRVLPENHSRGDWATREGGRHAEEAEFDIESCVACHGETGSSPVCADCHGR
jgi:hypothetical protein